MLALDDPYASQRVHSTHPLLLTCYKRIAPVDIHGCSAGATAYFSDLIQSTCYMHFPVFRRFQEGNVIIGADDVLQRLLVLAVFVAGLVEKGLNDLTAVIFLAVCAGDVAFSQAAFLHPAFGPAQIPGAIQIPLLAALAAFLIFAAGLTVGTTAADFHCTIHTDELLSE